MYLAEYSLEKGTFVQGVSVVSVPIESVLRDAQLNWYHLLDFCNETKADVFLRISISKGKVYLIRGITDTAGKSDSIIQFFESHIESLGNPWHSPSCATEHDRILGIGKLPPLMLNGWEYKVGSVSLASDLSITHQVIELISQAIVTQREFQYQVSASPLVDSHEVERLARKHVVQLDYESYIPPSLVSKQQKLAEKVGYCNFLIDQGVCCDAVFRDYVDTLLMDACRASVYEQGFKELPVSNDDDVKDWFETGLHLLKLKNLSIAYYMASARDLHSAREILGKDGSKLSQNFADSVGGAGDEEVDLFISYSSKDHVNAEVICKELEAVGINCWIAPRDILPGESYPSAIMRGIRSCKIFVLVFSKTANISPHVQREVERALSLGKYIIPFRLDDTVPTGDMEYLISNCQWLDAITPPIKRHIAILVNILCKILK